MDLFAPRPQRDAAHVALIKRWVAELLAPPPGAVVIVTELRCTEDGCPPLETVIVVLCDGFATVQYKVHKAMAMVDRSDLVALPPNVQWPSL